MADKVKLDHDWLEQAIESFGRHFMEVKPCPECDGGKHDVIIWSDMPHYGVCPNCKDGWVIKMTDREMTDKEILMVVRVLSILAGAGWEAGD